MEITKEYNMFQKITLVVIITFCLGFISCGEANKPIVLEPKELLLRNSYSNEFYNFENKIQQRTPKLTLMGEIIAVRLLEEPRSYSLVTIPNQIFLMNHSLVILKMTLFL
jgi:hypothetical protein